MKSFDLKPLIEQFNEYILENGSESDAVGARKEFGELIKNIFSPFGYAKATKDQLAQRKKQLDSFILICDALRASENESTYMIEALALAGRANTEQALGDLESAIRDFRRSADVAAGYNGGEEVRISGVLSLANLYGRVKKVPQESEKTLYLRISPLTTIFSQFPKAAPIPLTTAAAKHW